MLVNRYLPHTFAIDDSGRVAKNSKAVKLFPSDFKFGRTCHIAAAKDRVLCMDVTISLSLITSNLLGYGLFHILFIL